MNSKLRIKEGIPVVSVVIAVYNEEKRIGKCITSILQQTYQNFEIIVVNDGSTDNSPKVIGQYVKENTGKVFCIDKENGGQGSARNCGIKAAKGKYITFLDADDYVEKDYLEVLAAQAEKFECDVVCSGQHKVRENGEIIHSILYKPVNGTCLKRRLNISGKMYLNSYIRENKIFFPEGKTYEDNSFNLEAFFLTNKISFLSYAGYYQVVHEGSTTSKTIQIDNLPLAEWNDCIEKVMENREKIVDLQLFEFTVLSFFAYLLFVRMRKREYLSNADRESNVENAMMAADYLSQITTTNFPYAKKNKYVSLFRFKELSIIQKLGVKVYLWSTCYRGILKGFVNIFYGFRGKVRKSGDNLNGRKLR